ncbi:MAG: hypothetical protein ONB16_09985 [candidate division KSB1 bacterium]|nr:hypothetical protein [candidate division KSB1 bacterium]MDZ7318503.1 hypothetical protein [candidate division KSB1 bacterium]MDZ7340012.1 hypothetical protein [candidate division KSB1 bacterium]
MAEQAQALNINMNPKVHNRCTPLIILRTKQQLETPAFFWRLSSIPWSSSLVRSTKQHPEFIEIQLSMNGLASLFFSTILTPDLLATIFGMPFVVSDGSHTNSEQHGQRRGRQGL